MNHDRQIQFTQGNVHSYQQSLEMKETKGPPVNNS